MFFLCWHIYLLKYNKTFFRNYDGFDQNYVCFVYLGRWGRQIIRKLLSEHKLQIPLWNPSIGYGADIPTTFTAYIYDPFNWISLFIPEVYSEYGYNLMIFLKFYACGLAYSFFALHKKHHYTEVLAGAIIYTFSAVSYVGFYQSYFINPLIIFPVLITGTDCLFEDNKPVLYVVALAWSFFNYFYFAYMMCIFVFVYCVLKLLYSGEYRQGIKNVSLIISRFLIYSLLSAGIAAFELIPTLKVLLQAGRLGVQHYLPVWFDKEYYGGVFTGFTTGYNMLSRDCHIGFGYFALICVFTLFIVVRGKRQLKTEFVLATAGVCIPYIGHVLNGFSYTSNRWIWAYALIISYVVTVTIPYLKNISIRNKIILIVLSSLYSFIGLEYFSIQSDHFIAVSVLLILTTFLLLLFKEIRLMIFKALMIISVSFSVILMSMFTYDERFGNGFYENTDSGTAYNSMKGSGGLPLLDDINTSDGTRFSQYGVYTINNATWLYDNASGMNFYISIYNDLVDQFHNKLYVNTGPRNYSYSGLGRRSELLSLVGVNHFFVKKDEQRPEEYSVFETDKYTSVGTVKSYKPENDHTLFYLFDHSLSEDCFEELNPIERQQALMQCVVIEDEGNIGLNDLHLTNDEIPFVLQNVSASVVSNNIVETDENNEQIELLFEDVSDAELYLYFDNLYYENGNTTSYKINVDGFNNEEVIDTAHEQLFGYTIYSHMYGNKHSTLLELECNEAVNRLLITFLDTGKYTYKNIKLYARKNQTINSSMKLLDNKGIHDINIDVNKVNCSVETNRETYLFTSVPYSSGWTAYDNGNKVKPMKADIAFMAIPLQPGKHDIQLVYFTPGLFAGFSISIISCVILYLIYKKKI